MSKFEKLKKKNIEDLRDLKNPESHRQIISYLIGYLNSNVRFHEALSSAISYIKTYNSDDPTA